MYDEPPAWYYPVRESLGGALLLSGDAAGAEAVFREGMRRSPNNGRMLFGLLESLKAQKKSDAARWAQGEFDAAWKGADIPVAGEGSVALAEIKSTITSAKIGVGWRNSPRGSCLHPLASGPPNVYTGFFVDEYLT